MDPLTQNPFALLSSIAAPALLTNSSSVLALSTTNRMLRTRDLMRDLLAKSAEPNIGREDADFLISQVNRIEIQSGLLLNALHGIYLAMGSFASATLVTLIGAVVAEFTGTLWVGLIAIALGGWGVGCLVYGALRLFQATQISLANIKDEARMIRARLPAAAAGSPVPATDDPHIDGTHDDV